MGRLLLVQEGSLLSLADSDDIENLSNECSHHPTH